MSLSRGMRTTFIGVGALVAFSALTAVPAGASQSTIPSDCSQSTPSYAAVSLTCTSRPATQTWRVEAYCLTSRGVWLKVGNLVTGNGTSTVNCVAYPPDSVFFAASS